MILSVENFELQTFRTYAQLCHIVRLCLALFHSTFQFSVYNAIVKFKLFFFHSCFRILRSQLRLQLSRDIIATIMRYD